MIHYGKNLSKIKGYNFALEDLSKCFIVFYMLRSLFFLSLRQIWEWKTKAIVSISFI